MKAAFLTLTIVFALTCASAQTKNKKVKSETQVPVKQVATPQQPQTTQVFNFRITAEIINAIIMALKNSQDLDAKTSNTIITILVNQANDSTLNKPVQLKPKEK